jgi:hypothetical protein
VEPVEPQGPGQAPPVNHLPPVNRPAVGDSCTGIALTNNTTVTDCLAGMYVANLSTPLHGVRVVGHKSASTLCFTLFHVPHAMRGYYKVTVMRATFRQEGGRGCC